MQKNRNRLIIIIDSLGIGGAEYLIVPYLKYLDKTRFEPIVCALNIRNGNPIADRIRELGVRVDVFAGHKLLNPWGFLKLLHYFKEQRADLVHCHLHYSTIWGSLAAKILGIPNISTLHVLDNPPRGTRQYWRCMIMWWVLRNLCDQIITVSEEVRQHHIREGKIMPEKIHTIYNGIDLSHFVLDNDYNQISIRKSLCIPPDSPVIITVSVLRPQKGINYLIEALPIILNSEPELRILIVGEGDHKITLKQLAKSKGVQDRVIFAGFRNDVYELLTISNLFVLPTLDDAFPTVLLEAMAAQKPIIASNVGGVPEIIQHGYNGILVPPANPAKLSDACVRLLQNHEQAQTLADAARKSVRKRFNIYKNVQQLNNLYQQLLVSK